MKRVFFVCMACLLLAVTAGAQPDQPFTPGNLVLVDASEDRLIEVEFEVNDLQPGDFGEVNVVQVVTWPLGDTSRRRPLGLTFDPNGTAYVGITGVPTSATEQVDFPEGRGEVLRIFSDGSIDFTILPPEVTKGTWLSSFNPNEVFFMSNEPPPDISPSHNFRLRFSGEELVETTLFNVSTTAKGNGNLASGKALQLPDGRVLIPSEADNFINIYDESGGDPIDQIETEKAYRSLAFLEESNELLAIPGTNNVDRIDMQGNILGSFDFTIDSLGGVWNFTLIPGTENFVATNHNGPNDTKSEIFIYDSTRLNEAPLPAILSIVGLEDFGDDDGIASSLFDHAIVPEPTTVGDWTVR